MAWDFSSYKVTDKTRRWGTPIRNFIDAVQAALNWLLDNRAPLDHEHVSGGTIIVTRGTDEDRVGSGTTIHIRTDLPRVERVVDGSVGGVFATENQTLYSKRSVTEISQPSDDNAYQNAEDDRVRGKAVIRLPATIQSWLLMEFMAATAAGHNLVFDYMMDEADTAPCRWGLAYAVGNQELCDSPWVASATMAVGYQRCPTEPNGGTYEVSAIMDLTSGPQDSGVDLYSGSTIAAGGSYTAPIFGAGAVSGAVIKAYLKKTGSPTGNAVAKIYNAAGDTLLATSGTLDVSTLTTDYTLQTFTIASPLAHASATGYRVVIEYTGGSGAAYVSLGFDSTGAAVGLKYTSGPTWNTQTGAPLIAVHPLLTVGASEPTWPITEGDYVGDNGVLWRCIASDNYDTISLTGETTPATAYTEGSKTFSIPSIGISEGSQIRAIIIRQPDSPEHAGDLLITRITAQAVEA